MREFRERHAHQADKAASVRTRGYSKRFLGYACYGCSTQYRECLALQLVRDSMKAVWSLEYAYPKSPSLAALDQLTQFPPAEKSAPFPIPVQTALSQILPPTGFSSILFERSAYRAGKIAALVVTPITVIPTIH